MADERKKKGIEASLVTLRTVEAQEIREYVFDNDVLLIALVDGTAYVAIKPICDFLQIDWSGQLQRIKDDEVLDAEQRLVVFSPPNDQRREMVGLPIEFVHGWLFSITVSRLKRPTPEMIEKIQRYRRRCFQALWKEFGEKTLQQQSPSPSVVALEHLRDESYAIAEMAQQQIQLIQEVERAHLRLDKAGEIVLGMHQNLKAVNQRLTTVERQSLPTDTISDEQATDVAISVQRLAELLTRKAANASSDKPIPNYYQGIFLEIRNLTGATRHTLIKKKDYPKVMEILERWMKAARGEDPDGPSGEG